MKKILVLLCGLFASMHLAAQTYPEGTKWTEIRLDTLKYDNWFSEDGQPNYEVKEFYVEGQTLIKGDKEPFNNVYIKREDAPDSLAFYVKDGAHIWAAINWPKTDRPTLGPVSFYGFDWTLPYFRFIMIKALITNIYGGAEYDTKSDDLEEKEGLFGGVRPLTYSNLRVRVKRAETPKKYEYDICLIKGIGVTSWLGPDCIFGPLDASEAYDHFYHKISNPNHPYRSMLVHFERNGEVLYDVWPSPEGMTNEVKYVPAPEPENDTPILFDLSGRRLEQKPTKGIYIQGGRKVLIK